MTCLHNMGTNGDNSHRQYKFSANPLTSPKYISTYVYMVHYNVTHQHQRDLLLKFPGLL